MSRKAVYSVELGVGDTGRGRVEPKNSVPGLLWAELVGLMDEWGKFSSGRKGTRFDPWLGKTSSGAGKGNGA